jgi:hypothetical protein
VLNERASRIQSQIESQAPNKEKYSLVAKIANVGVALLVYALDDGLARKVKEVQTQWTGCGLLNMGNKGAVGVRFRVEEPEDSVGEIYTYVEFHVTSSIDYTLYTGLYAPIWRRMSVISNGE